MYVSLRRFLHFTMLPRDLAWWVGHGWAASGAPEALRLVLKELNFLFQAKRCQSATDGQSICSLKSFVTL